jgi:NTE family protein
MTGAAAMSIPRIKSILLCCLVLATTYTRSQDVPPPANTERKLGLVLEGGGALGLAHIGVIQWMEEHRIPVSYLAGTSMGGLVAGVYATGRNAAEVREVVESINWDQVLAGQIPYSDLSFRRKQDEHEYPSSLEFGLRKGVQFPAGFNSGQQVSLILDRIALPYSGLSSFNDLPIPFACVATDLVSGKAHVFHEGPLGLALRATMSIPGLFTPVRTGDHIYADGGLLNNIPIDVARDMGANIVLGVHLETTPLKPDASLSSFAVLSESISVMIAANELHSIEQADLLITVPLQKYNSLDYDKANEIIKAGYDAAAAKASVLSAFSVDEVTWKKYLAERSARRKVAPVPQFVHIIGTDPELAAEMERTLFRVLGNPMDIAALDQSIMALDGMGRFDNLNYWMVEKNGQPGLEVATTEKAYAPPLVRPLILIDGSNYNNVLFSIGARGTFMDFGSFRSELRVDLIVGSQYGLGAEYYHPIQPTSKWFVAPRASFNSNQLSLYNDTNLIADYRQRLSIGGLDGGYEFGRTGELRFGYEGGYEELNRTVGNPTSLPQVAGATGDIRFQYQLEDLDNPVIPRAGRGLRLDAKWFNVNPDAPGGFPLSEIESQNFFRINQPSSVFFNASGGTSFGYQTGIPPFSLGGSQQLLAWGSNELLTNQYFLGQLGYIRELFKLPPFLGNSLNVIGMYEAGKTYQLPLGPKPPNFPMDVAVGFVVNTIFGPVEIGGAIGDYGRSRFFFKIGRLF